MAGETNYYAPINKQFSLAGGEKAAAWNKAEALKSEVAKATSSSPELHKKQQEIKDLQKTIPGQPGYDEAQAQKAKEAQVDKILQNAVDKSNNEIAKQRRVEANIDKAQKKAKRKDRGPGPRKGKAKANTRSGAAENKKAELDMTSDIQDNLLVSSMRSLNVWNDKAPPPTEWIARVLTVHYNTAAESVLQDWYHETEVNTPFYQMHCQRIQPTSLAIWEHGFYVGDMKAVIDNPDAACPDPCPAKGGVNRAIAEQYYPIFYPMSPELKVPQPGDLINVHIHPLARKGMYAAFTVGRPLADLHEDISAVKRKIAKLKEAFPDEKEEETDEKGCASGKVSDKEILKLSRITPPGKIRNWRKSVNKLNANTKRFLKAFDEELKNSGGKAKITSAMRTAWQQGAIMYRNWSKFTSVDTTEDASKAADAYIRKLYRFWGKDANEMLEVLKSIKAAGGWKTAPSSLKKKAETIAKRHQPRCSHAKGTALDISYRGPTALNWIALKNAARRTCSHILVEKDHWHVSTCKRDKWGWSSKSFGRKFAWLEKSKGPPKDDTA